MEQEQGPHQTHDETTTKGSPTKEETEQKTKSQEAQVEFGANNEQVYLIQGGSPEIYQLPI